MALTLAAIAIESEEESKRKMEAAPADKYILPSHPQWCQFLLTLIFFRVCFSRASRPKQWPTIRWHHKLTSQSDAPCRPLREATSHKKTLRSTFGEERSWRRLGEVSEGTSRYIKNAPKPPPCTSLPVRSYDLCTYYYVVWYAHSWFRQGRDVGL